MGTRVGFRTHQRNRNIIRFNCLFCVCFGILKLAYEQAHMCDFGENFGDNFCKEIITLSVVLFLPACVAGGKLIIGQTESVGHLNSS